MQSALSWLSAYLRIFSLSLVFGGSVSMAMLIAAADSAASYYKVPMESIQPLNGTILLAWGVLATPAAFVLALGELINLFSNRRSLTKALLKLLPSLLCFIVAMVYVAILTPRVHECLQVWQEIQQAKTTFTAKLPSFLQPGGSDLKDIQAKAASALQKLKQLKPKTPSLPKPPQRPLPPHMSSPRLLPDRNHEAGPLPALPGLPGAGPFSRLPGANDGKLAPPPFSRVQPAVQQRQDQNPLAAIPPGPPALPQLSSPLLLNEHEDVPNLIKNLESLKAGSLAETLQTLANRITQLEKDMKQLHQDSQILMVCTIVFSFLALLVAGAELRRGTSVDG